MNESKPIRVLQVLHILNRGGAEAIIMNLYRKLDRTRIQFDFLVHEKEKGLFEDEITQLGGKIYRVQAFKGYNVLSYYQECKHFFAQHPEIKIVHGHLGSSAALYLKAAKVYGKFTIAHSHSAGSIRDFRGFAYAFFSFPTRYVADQLFGCSTEAGIQRYGKTTVKSPKYKNFNNAVDVIKFKFNLEKRNLKRKELGIPEQKIAIGTVGRITEPKNPPRIYSLFKFLVNNYENVICYWIGTGELEDVYQQKIKEDNLQDRIIMTGVRSDIPELMSAFDGMIFPSLWEGLPVSVIEAQMANLPTILADTISKETEISPLLHWHSLNESDEVWAKGIVEHTKAYLNCRENYNFNTSSTGYDINETVKWLMSFYEKNGGTI
ncbi:glycosyltransferase [Prevotella sp. HUN102]|uniref:glycosyltransferase n=1 Tax=Prevotella sp. HUN102 TaxID=1392486 RepID=UPI00048C2253|nr:glycosyltransferase [Prevotella sp. HUN102]